MSKVFEFGKSDLTIGTALEISRGQIRGVLTNDIREKVQRSRKIVE